MLWEQVVEDCIYIWICLENYEALLGGFIWDWVDQAILKQEGDIATMLTEEILMIPPMIISFVAMDWS